MNSMANLFAGCWPAGRFVFALSVDDLDGLLWHRDLPITISSAGAGRSRALSSKSKPRTARSNFSIAVVQANGRLEDQSQVKMGPFGTLVGVYDGHGGPEASRFISSHIFTKIEGFALESGSMTRDVLRRAFIDTEEEFVSLVDRKWRSMPHIASVGSCCLVGVICSSKMYIANLGDSRVVLGTLNQGRMVATRLTEEHNAGNAEVREELKAQHPDDADIVVLKQGVWRVKGIIQVSRSIGDVYLKKPEVAMDPIFSHHVLLSPLMKPILSAEPSIVERVLSPNDCFLIFASDGLWEHISDDDAVNLVSGSSRHGIAKLLVEAALEEAAKKRRMTYAELKRIEPGMRRYFHDDISVVVVYLDQKESSPASSSAASPSFLRACPKSRRTLDRIRRGCSKSRQTVDSIDAPVDIYGFDNVGPS